VFILSVLVGLCVITYVCRVRLHSSAQYIRLPLSDSRISPFHQLSFFDYIHFLSFNEYEFSLIIYRCRHQGSTVLITRLLHTNSVTRRTDHKNLIKVLTYLPSNLLWDRGKTRSLAHHHFSSVLCANLYEYNDTAYPDQNNKKLIYLTNEKYVLARLGEKISTCPRQHMTVRVYRHLRLHSIQISPQSVLIHPRLTVMHTYPAHTTLESSQIHTP
jgi:hypothetical protein